MIDGDPSRSPIQDHNGEEEKLTLDGISMQESCTTGPGDLFWEHKSTLLWALVIIGVGHHGELEHFRRLRLLPFVKERRVPPAPLRPSTEETVRFTSSRQDTKGVRDGRSALCRKDGRQRKLPQPSLSPTDQVLT